jgi:ArsR family transcriptional regulator, arsenate/arsenite/antimonite-responsive transcriptional repressor
MGLSKTQLFSAQQNQIAGLAKALSHPARVAILELLLHQKSCICGAIVDELPLAQATISQHLRELKAAGIIKGEIEGNAICYCIDPDKMTPLIQFLQTLQYPSLSDTAHCC